MENERMVRFSMGNMIFEYDENKNQMNIKKHGISFKSAARVFFDYDRIEYFDEEHISARMATNFERGLYYGKNY